MADSELREIRHESGRVTKRELAVKLQPVSRRRNGGKLVHCGTATNRQLEHLSCDVDCC